MRSVRWLPAMAALVVGSLLLNWAAANPEPLRVKLPAGPHPVAEVLKELETQTGNRVVDRRSAGASATVEIGFDGQTFWQALDRLARKLDAQIALYHDDGVRLIDGPARGAAVDAGVCRVDVKTLAVQRDLDTDRRSCIVQLEVAWEPRFEPIFLTVEGVQGVFAADGAGKELAFGPLRGTAQQVTQRRAQLIELRLPAPLRSAPAIAKLNGDLRFIGPTQIVSATFAKLTPGAPKQVYEQPGVKDPVSVFLNKVVVKKDAWTFDLEIRNPKETPALESFQQAAWIENTRISLERIKGGVKEIWSPHPDDWTGDVDAAGAKLTYVFTGAAAKGSIGEWTLVCRTPGRLVETKIPFEFRAVALP